MIQEPKLLTEAEAVELFSLKYSQVERVLVTLRERGLIAPEPEPVDPLLAEARQICTEAFGVDYTGETCATRGALLAAYNALRRGMELGRAERPELTRDMVKAAWEHYTLNGPRGADGLHAALRAEQEQSS